MANFTIPFGSSGEKRFPTTSERQNGFLCGPADRALFTGELYRLEAEIGEVMSYAGIAGSDSDMTQLRQAILALISAATGGNPAGYVLMTQARARLPIFPEVDNVDGRIVVTSPSTGTVRLPGGVNFNHRGIFTVTTSQTDFATDPSKTYHLRWDQTNGFRLRDLANAGYNPTALAETNTIFDSTYDDMLIARVITNSSNIPTITNLANKDRIRFKETKSGLGTIVAGGNGQDGIIFTDTSTYNWARTPMNIATGYTGHANPTVYTHGFANRIESEVTTRYTSTVTVKSDYTTFSSPVETVVGSIYHNLVL